MSQTLDSTPQLATPDDTSSEEHLMGAGRTGGNTGGIGLGGILVIVGIVVMIFWSLDRPDHRADRTRGLWWLRQGQVVLSAAGKTPSL